MAARLVCATVVALVCYWALGSFDTGRGSKAVPYGTLAYGQALLYGALAGWAYPAIWLKDCLQKRRRELVRALPFFLDIITLCVEAGLNFQGAVVQAVDKGPSGVLKDEFQRVLRDIRAGRSRADALRALTQRLKEPSVSNFVSAVIQAESMGMNLGPVLRAQADQRRTERFLRAEKLAMEAPVKMLFPLIAFIFPCTFIVLFFPIVMKFMNSGL
jgi:tight adherence protein C